MYKILLADDEGIELDAMKFILDKNFNGMCNVATAKTGRGAIELAETFRPDIAVMDIRMPGINGIDAMREMRSIQPNIIFIIMTAYDKFEYAKDAINISVFEFLTKPVNKGAVVDTLQRAMKKVDAERRMRNDDLKNRERLENMLPVLENSFVYMILSQSDDREAYKRICGLLCVDKPCGSVMVLELRHMGGGDLIDLDFKANEVYSDVRALIKESFLSIVGPPMANRIIFVHPADEPKDEYYERLLLIEKGRTLTHKIEDKIGVECKLGIGATTSIDDLCRSYGQAVKAVKLCKGIVAHFNDLPMVQGYEDGYPIDWENHLEEMVLKGDVEQATKDAEMFYDWMVERYADYDMTIRLKVLEFVMRSEYNFFHEVGTRYNFLDRSDYMQSVLDARNYDELKQWFIIKISGCAREIANKSDEEASSTIKKAKAYIDKNYNHELTLDEVSKEVFISPYYFSKLFKEKTGYNFIDYLTTKRIETAKLLLKDETKNIKEICKAVGYGDPNYFSRLFKRIEGATPTEWRDGVLKGTGGRRNEGNA